MPTVFVLDVEEFRPLIDDARKRLELQVSGPKKGYWTLTSGAEMSFRRSELGLNPAVWNGVLTVGMLGHIVQFDREVLRILEARL